jgi:hypothetical protein
MQIDIHFYKTKKFQGLVLSFDFDVPQCIIDKTICVITFKFLFFGFWIAFTKKHKW